MISALLSVAVTWCLLVGRMPWYILLPLCAGVGVCLGILGRHAHSHFLTIDGLAQKSRLSAVNPDLKLWSVLAAMVICVSSGSPITGVFLAGIALYLTVRVGGLRTHAYLHLLSLPVSFLMISTLALLFSVTTRPGAPLSLPFFGVWLSVSVASQTQAMLVTCRAFGAVSCLYLLCLTMPMSELIGALRHAHCPSVVTDLMYLIYRYVFILLSMHHEMRNAAKSRLGFYGYRTTLRTTGQIYANLLSRSYRLASQSYDALESRCFDGEIRFLEQRKLTRPTHVSIAVGIAVCAFCTAILF